MKTNVALDAATEAKPSAPGPHLVPTPVASVAEAVALIRETPLETPRSSSTSCCSGSA